ncbi:MAG: S9 family peptidase [Pseudomonadales bacterium]|jgi:oligopeptidase B|nr:S9 family peptidase [Pseudomonadales bacterium]
MKRSGRLATDVPAPIAEPRPHAAEWHGVRIEDPWHWLRDPAYPELRDDDVRAYLEAENAWFDVVMRPVSGLVETLYGEIRGRQQEDEAAVPWHEGAWTWRWYFEHGAQYGIWARRPRDGGDEQIVLDENRLAEGHEYFRLGALEPDRAGHRVAWSVDVDGSERFTLRVMDCAAGTKLPDEIPDTLGAPVWTADGEAFFYTVVNDAWRPYEVRLHRLGRPVAEDRVVYTESDDAFFVGIDETSDRRFLVIASGDHVTSEVRLLALEGEGAFEDPVRDQRLVSARRSGHEYDVDHGDGRLWIRTNDVHENFRLVSADAAAPAEANWREEIAASDAVYLTGMQAFAGFLVLTSRVDGLDAVRIRPHEGAGDHEIEFPESSYTVGLGTNAEFATRTLRLGYASMVTPDTVYDYDLDARRLEVRKVRQVPSGYDASQYVTERLTVAARDGTQVPVSVVRRRDAPLDGSGLLHLYGYGAYGMAIPPSFSAARLSLLDRGFSCAIAHVRGGDDLGRAWYRAGKLTQRNNSFDDFVDVARGLVEAGYAAPGRIAISGGSAGGELVGVAMNRAPELWGAVVAHVPFVDVLQTMLDGSLPLTPIEWPEWGNPIEDAEAFELIRGYSPVDRLEARAYPPLLVTAGVNDPRVTYWEPAKWVARQRHLRTDDAIVLLKTNMSAGHGGTSGRFEAIREIAEEYAFVISVLEAPEAAL